MEFRRPDRRVKLCWTVYTLAAAFIPLIASVVLFHLPMLPQWMPPCFTVLWSGALLLILTVYYPQRYRRMRYAIGEGTVAAVRGVFFLSHQRIPLSAVRHITVIRGPLERITGICALLISATGGRLLLEGIPADEAKKMTEAII